MAKRTSGFVAGLAGLLACVIPNVARSADATDLSLASVGFTDLVPTNSSSVSSSFAPVKTPSDLDYNFKLYIYGDDKDSIKFPKFFTLKSIAPSSEFKLAYFGEDVPKVNTSFEERFIPVRSRHHNFRLAYFDKL